jgi:hypothetical protein
MAATIAPSPAMSIIEGFSTAFGVIFNSVTIIRVGVFGSSRDS